MMAFFRLFWRSFVASVIGSAFGAVALVASMLFYTLAFAPGFKVALIDPAVREFGGFLFVVFVVSLFYTLPCALLILLPLSVALRRWIVVEPVSGTAAFMILAALGGVAVLWIVDATHSSSPPRDVMPAFLMSLPFSMSAAFARARSIRRSGRGAGASPAGAGPVAPA